MDVAVLSQTVLNIYRTDTTQTRLALLLPEDGGSTLLRNVGNYQSIRCHVLCGLIVDGIRLRLGIELKMLSTGTGRKSDKTGSVRIM